MSTPTPMPSDAAGPLAPPATAIPADADAPEPEIGDRWGTFPPLARRAALDARLAEWAAMPDHGTLLSPFDGDDWDHPQPMTGADVYYLAARSLVGPDGDIREGLVSFVTLGAGFPELHLERVNLNGALLKYAKLAMAHLEHAYLGGAQLEHADLRVAQLEYAMLRDAHLGHADLFGAQLGHAHLNGAQLEDTNLREAHLEHAHLGGAHFEHANLRGAHLEHADLVRAHLTHANLTWAHLEQASIREAGMASADLRGAFLDAGADLTNANVTDAEHGSVRVADVRWQAVNLAVVKEWPANMVLGDEQEAWRLGREPLPKTETREEHRQAVESRRDKVRDAFRAAARANRQLAAAMRDQGMNDEADHFAYRAQVMQRHLRRRQGQCVRAFGSWLLDRTSGYGYRPARSVVTYVLIILLFAGAYLLTAQFAAPHLRWDEALVLSVSSFHGRGFFTSGISLGDNLARLAAVEAIIGLLVEITFIATFTQRFFAR